VTDLDVLALSAPIGIWRSTPQDGVVWVNQRFEEITGMTGDRALGLGWLDAVHPDDRDRVLLARADALAEDRDMVVEFRVVNDGAVRPVRARMSAYRPEPRGPVSGYVGALEEIGGAERGGSQLEQLGQVVAMLEATPDFAVVTDRFGRLLYMNPPARAVFGVPADQNIVGEDATRWWRYADHSRAALESGVAELVEKGRFRRELTLLLPGDVELPVIQMTITHLGADGDLELYSTIARDISDLRDAEERLEENATWFRSLAEHSSDFVLVYDAEGRVVHLSPPAARYTGYEIGMRLGDLPLLHHPDDAETVGEQFDRLVEAGRGASSPPFEVRIRRFDGEYRWLELIATNLLDDPAVGGIVINARDVSDRREALASLSRLNASLQQSNETLRAIVGNSPIAIYAFDRYGTVTLWNAASERTFGWTAEEAMGRECPVTRPEDREAEAERMARVMAGEVITSEEVTRATRWGTEVHMSFAAAPLRDEQGEITGVLAVSSDITERLEMERQIRDSESRFRALVQNVAESIVVLGADGNVRYSSPAGSRMLGYEEGSGEGSDPLSLVHPDDQEAVADVLVEAFATPGMHGPLSLRVLAADGTWHHLEAFGNNLLDDPLVGGVVITARDVTERIEAEEALRRSDERIAALVENLSDVITIYGPDGRLVYSSPAAERLFGFVEGDESWTNPTARIHPDDVERVVAAFGEQLAAGGSDPVRFRLRVADDTWRDVEAVLKDMNDDSAVGGIVVTTRDVTERTRAESLVSDQAHVLRLIAQGAPLTDTLATMCEVVERNVPDSRCSVLLVDEEEGVLRCGAAPNLPPGWISAVQEVAIGPDQGTCGAAAFSGRAEVSEDIEQDPRWKDYAPLARSHGLRACWSTPIVASTGDRVVGTFAVYFDTVRRPDPREEEVVAMITALGAIAIERKASEDRLAHQAHHDPLTGLPNRVLFVEFLTLALARAQRQQTAVAVLFLDLDRFKFVNDSLGHDAGDEFLVRLSERLRGVLRPGDTVARFGGDEFTVLCDDLSADDARAQAIEVAQRLLDVTELPIDIAGEPTRLSSSIGIAIASPGDGPESLLRDADAAMYRAKERGKGRWVLFDEEMRSSVLVRLETENALHHALERSELRIHYQPIMSLTSSRCIGAEALVRWEHPERGLVTPDDFIGLAEESGLIVPMGAWVLEEACRTVVRWHEQAGVSSPFSVSVNLSARQLAQTDVVQLVRSALETTGADPAMLGLEITESVLMGETSVETVAALKALGVKLSIDDFGTGYSSLGYLKRFPVDVVKVDRSFVDGLGIDPEDSAIVAAVVSLGHALGLEVVAEGVETERQLAELVRLGCDQAQGFWFAAAQPEREFLGTVCDLHTAKGPLGPA
jgi:diguanylate cyclase (GGDEF)-like protein/PAS domain S-box-containing protein